MFYDLKDKKPKNSGENWVAPNATIIGDVRLEKNSSIWFNAVIRGDVHYIKMGNKVTFCCAIFTHDFYQLPVGVKHLQTQRLGFCRWTKQHVHTVGRNRTHQRPDNLISPQE